MMPSEPTEPVANLKPHKPIRAVIDTNLIMTAMLSSSGAAAKLIDWLTKEDDYFQLLLSRPIWQEYQAVSEWLIPENRQVERERILNVLLTQADWIQPEITFSVCSDDDDNRFLECAVAGQADFLVTKNIKHFPQKEYKGVQIIRIRKFLTTLEKLERAV
ncbi:MAG: putative toxin-antitoxin system toxin component, PIN family [Chloroflexota bacterium]